MAKRMQVDPGAIDARDDGAACPTAPRSVAAVTPLSPEDEAARRAALPETARRALEEAEARHAARADGDGPKEIGGRDGPEPVRYGDWERKGIAVDF